MNDKIKIEIEISAAHYLLDTCLDKKEADIEYYMVGKLMNDIKKNGLFIGDDFYKWVSDRYGFESRKATYIIRLQIGREGRNTIFQTEG